MACSLDLVEGRRDMALVRMAAQKKQIKRYHNKKINLQRFKVGDYVLRSIFAVSQESNVGKLGPNWEDPIR